MALKNPVSKASILFIILGSIAFLSAVVAQWIFLILIGAVCFLIAMVVSDPPAKKRNAFFRTLAQKKPLPMPRAIIGAFLIIVGCFGILSMLLALARDFYFINLTVVCLPIGMLFLIRQPTTKRNSFFTDAEFERACEAAIDMEFDKCQQNPANLRQLFKELPLGHLSAVPDMEEAEKNPDYLRGLIREHVNHLPERGVVGIVQQDEAVATRLGCSLADQDRLAATMNGPCWLLLAFGIIGLLLSGLFPPWTELTGEHEGGLFSTTVTTGREFAGWDYYRSSEKTAFIKEFDPIYYQVDLGTLQTEWFILAVAVTVGMIVLRPRRYPPAELGEGSAQAVARVRMPPYAIPLVSAFFAALVTAAVVWGYREHERYHEKHPPTDRANRLLEINSAYLQGTWITDVADGPRKGRRLVIQGDQFKCYDKDKMTSAGKLTLRHSFPEEPEGSFFDIQVEYTEGSGAGETAACRGSWRLRSPHNYLFISARSSSKSVRLFGSVPDDNKEKILEVGWVRAR